MMTDRAAIAERIRQAFWALKNADEKYFDELFEQRNPGPKAQGSVFEEPMTAADIGAAFAETGQQFDPGAAKFGDCAYFKALIPGKIGVIGLAELPADFKVQLLDPKATVGTTGGSVEATIVATDRLFDKLSTVEWTTVVVGKEKPEGPEMVFTLHPGAPAPRSSAANDPALVGKEVTAAEALKLGLTIAKIARKE